MDIEPSWDGLAASIILAYMASPDASVIKSWDFDTDIWRTRLPPPLTSIDFRRPHETNNWTQLDKRSITYNSRFSASQTVDPEPKLSLVMVLYLPSNISPGWVGWKYFSRSPESSSSSMGSCIRGAVVSDWDVE
jgi:hypothetical protein